MPTRRRLLRAILAPTLLFAAVGTISSAAILHTTPPDVPENTVPSIMSDPIADRPLHLAPATSPPAAAPVSLTQSRLANREVFAFAPYWMLDVAKTFDLRHVTTIAYFGIDVRGDGSIKSAGNGWIGYQSQDLADLITRAHRAGIRAVLTVKAFSNDTIHALATNGAAQATLARNLIDATRAKSFDGVNVDFEGTGNADRSAFTALASSLSDALHGANPAWQVTLDTYASSASDGGGQGFFDVTALARSVDSLFVMAYDMYQRGVASPNAALPDYQRAIAAYTRAVQPNKIVLGMPFYGYDFPTQDGTPGAQATGAPAPVSYSEITGHPRYWDADASVPWTAYQSGGQWHEIYYDDASSLALKARFANNQHLRGTGAWALGMNGRNGDLVAALLGTSTTIITGASGPPAASAPKPQPSEQPAKTASSPRPAPTATATSSPKSSPTPAPTSSPAPLVLPLPTKL